VPRGQRLRRRRRFARMTLLAFRFSSDARIRIGHDLCRASTRRRGVKLRERCIDIERPILLPPAGEGLAPKDDSSCEFTTGPPANHRESVDPQDGARYGVDTSRAKGATLLPLGPIGRRRRAKRGSKPLDKKNATQARRVGTRFSQNVRGNGEHLFCRVSSFLSSADGDRPLLTKRSHRSRTVVRDRWRPVVISVRRGSAAPAPAVAP
jgi:hypothetical protein